MHEVVDITTTTHRYIANGILTHNKLPACGSGSGTPVVYKIKQLFNCVFQSNYVPIYPFTSQFVFSITNSPTICTSGVLTTAATVTTTTSAITGFSYFVGASITFLAPDTADWSIAATVKDANNKVANNNGNAITGTYTVACLTPDTLIETYFGKQILLRDIKVGDELLSIDPDTMQYEKTIVTAKKDRSVDALYILNNEALKCSAEHSHIVKRDSEWTVLRSDDLVIGDIMLTSNLKEFSITKIDIIK